MKRRQLDFSEISRESAAFSDEARRADVRVGERQNAPNDEWAQVLVTFAALKTSSPSPSSDETESKIAATSAEG